MDNKVYGEWVIIDESIPEDLESALEYLDLWKKFVLRKLKKQGLTYVDDQIVKKEKVDEYTESSLGIKIFMTDITNGQK